MLQTEPTLVRDLFCLFWTRGVSLGAFAHRCGMPVERITRELAGLGNWPEWLALEDDIRGRLLEGLTWDIPNAQQLGEGYKVLYCATSGPQGSVRWHYWSVSTQLLPHILRSRTQGELISFSTLDGLAVALNPEHIVTLMYGDEDTDRLMGYAADVTPTQSITGALVPYHKQLEVLELEFRQFRQAVQKWGPDGFDDLPFAADLRAPRAFLLDLRHPFMDHSISSLGEEAVTEGPNWHLWDELDGILETNTAWRSSPVTFADRDGCLTHVTLPQHQITVLECPRRLQALAAHRDTIESADVLSAAAYREGLMKTGLFSAEEIDHMIGDLTKLAGASKHRSRRRLCASRLNLS